MRYLLDEQMSEASALALNAITDDTFAHILDYHPAGAQDPVIPALCRRHEVDALVSANVRDFGARLYYYQALLAESVHVVVIRPGSAKHFGPPEQVSIVTRYYRRMASLLESADGPTLIKLTPSRCEPRSISELVTEIEGKKGRLP